MTMKTKFQFRRGAPALGIAAFICLIAVGNSSAQVQAWGSGDYEALGLGNYDHQPSPQTVPNTADITSLKAGRFHTLGVKADGTVLGWGGGLSGKLCDNNDTDHDIPSPATLPDLTDVTAVAPNDRNSLFLLADGTLKVCGNNQVGQLGNGTTGSVNAVAPQSVPNM